MNSEAEIINQIKSILRRDYREQLEESLKQLRAKEGRLEMLDAVCRNARYALDAIDLFNELVKKHANLERLK